MKKRLNGMKQSRRAVLRKSVGVIAGGIGVVGGVGTASAALPYTVVLYGDGDLSYTIRVSGSMARGYDLESNDVAYNSHCTGFIINSSDSWDFSGNITEIVLRGKGGCVFYTNGDGDPSYSVDIYTDGDDYVHYLWEQVGAVTGREGSLESNDRISRRDNGNHVMDGYVSSGADKFTVSGYPERIQVSDGPRDSFHWRAFGL